MNPPNWVTRPVMTPRKAAMTSRKSSGSSRAPIAVDPTTSMNMTLSSLRSGEGATTATGGAARGITPRGAPQSPQNRLSAGLSLPHVPHRHGRGVPQSPQNFRSFATTAPHRAQIIRAPGQAVKGPASHRVVFLVCTERPILTRADMGGTGKMKTGARRGSVSPSPRAGFDRRDSRIGIVAGPVTTTLNFMSRSHIRDLHKSGHAQRVALSFQIRRDRDQTNSVLAKVSPLEHAAARSLHCGS